MRFQDQASDSRTREGKPQNHSTFQPLILRPTRFCSLPTPLPSASVAVSFSSEGPPITFAFSRVFDPFCGLGGRLLEKIFHVEKVENALWVFWKIT